MISEKDLSLLIDNYKCAYTVIGQFDLVPHYTNIYDKMRKTADTLSIARKMPWLAGFIAMVSDDDIHNFEVEPTDEIVVRVLSSIVATRLLIESSVMYKRDTAWWDYHIMAGTGFCLTSRGRINESLH